MGRTKTIRYNARAPRVTSGLSSPVVTVTVSRKKKTGAWEEMDVELQTCGWYGLATFIDAAREAAREYVKTERERVSNVAKRMGIE